MEPAGGNSEFLVTLVEQALNNGRPVGMADGSLRKISWSQAILWMTETIRKIAE